MTIIARRGSLNGAVLSATLLLTIATVGCGGGGAASPSAPEPPASTGGTPPSGTPTTPTQPPAASPPAANPPAAPPPTAPSSAIITTPERTFSPSAVTIATNGTVTWQALDDRHEIIFVNSAPPGGNPGEVEEGSSVARTFPAAGTYEFECLRHRDKGMRGAVVVQGASQAPPPSTPPPTTPPSTPPGGTTVTVTTPNETFSPSNVTIPVGGTVLWEFSQTRHNVVFQGTAPAGGNIPDTEPGRSASRTFAAPGTYNYLCTRHSGMTGRVTVQ